MLLSEHVSNDPRGIDMFTFSVFTNWMGGQTRKPQFMKNAAMVDCLNSLLDTLQRQSSEITDTRRPMPVSLMHDNDERGYDSMISVVNDIQQRWWLLPDPHKRCIPNSVRSKVQNFCTLVLSNPNNYDTQRTDCP